MSYISNSLLEKRVAFIWEVNSYLPALLAKLRENGWHIKAIVHKSPTESEMYGIPVVRRDNFIHMLELTDIIIPGDATPETTADFFDFLCSLRFRNGLLNKVVHPAAFADAHQYSRPRFLVTGLPGSGNMIAQTLYLELIKSREAPDFSSLDKGLIGLASAYFWSLHNLIEDNCNIRGAHYWHVSPWETTYGAFVTGPARDYQTWQISGLPLRSHVWSIDFSFSHEAPTRQTIDYFARAGFSTVVLLRHPLDVIVSNAGKISRDSGLKEPGLLLANADWFRSMVSACERYLEAVVQNRNQINTFYYEDILSHPVSYMSNVQKLLGTKTTPLQMAKLWKQFGLKPLFAALGKHFWKPSEGKWRNYMNPMQKQILLSSKLPELASMLNYSFGDLSGDYECPVHWNRLTSEECKVLAYWDTFYSYFLPKEITIEHPEVRIRSNKELGIVTFGYDTEDLKLNSYFEDLLENQVFQELVSSAYIDDFQSDPRWHNSPVVSLTPLQL